MSILTMALLPTSTLQVTAEDETTGAKADIRITNSGRLSSEEVDAMIADAERMRAADEARVEAVEARGELESYLYRAIELVEATGNKKVRMCCCGSVVNVVTCGLTDCCLQQLDAECKEVRAWLDMNPNATKTQYAEKTFRIQASTPSYA